MTAMRVPVLHQLRPLFGKLDSKLNEDPSQHQSVARCVHQLATTQPTDYEKRLLIFDRHTLAIVTGTQDNLIRLLLTHFMENCNTHDPMSVKQTLLVFLRDWIAESKLLVAVVSFHQPFDMSVYNLFRAELDWKLWNILMQVHHSIENLPKDGYNTEMVKKWTPFWITMSTEKFHQSCVALRMLMIRKQEEYLTMFQYTNIQWQTYNQGLQNTLVSRATPLKHEPM